MNKSESVAIDDIILDTANPRIKNFVEMYAGTDLNDEQMLLALGAGASDEGGSTAVGSYQRLKQSIKASNGIVEPVILKTLDDGRYTCVEGNTRVAIYRELRADDIKQGKGGEEWDHIPALSNDTMDEEEAHKIRLQVHLVGKRQWDPYSKAKYLHELSEDFKMPMAQLIAFCGGSRADVERDIKAYVDMETHYRPVVEEEDGDFDPSRFSAFVELQKPGIKNAIFQAGYTEEDFSQWVENRKIHPINHVRKLPQILNSPEAKSVFLQKDTRAAVTTIDAPTLDTQLKEANISQLAKALQEKIGQLSYDEADEIANKPDSDEHMDLMDILASVGELLGIEIPSDD